MDAAYSAVQHDQSGAMRRLKVGDYVREVDGKAIGIIVHIMRGVVVVNWPPSREALLLILTIW
jgi:hypothetical protein